MGLAGWLLALVLRLGFKAVVGTREEGMEGGVVGVGLPSGLDLLTLVVSSVLLALLFGLTSVIEKC